MRGVLVLLVVVFSHLQLKAQQNDTPPPFRDMLAAATSDSQKLNVYRKIHAYYQSRNTDSSKYYMEQGLNLFTAHGYVQGRAPLLAMISGAYSDMGNAEMAQKAADESFVLYTELKDEVGIAKINNTRACANSGDALISNAFSRYDKPFLNSCLSP